MESSEIGVQIQASKGSSEWVVTDSVQIMSIALDLLMSSFQ